MIEFVRGLKPKPKNNVLLRTCASMKGIPVTIPTEIGIPTVYADTMFVNTSYRTVTMNPMKALQMSRPSNLVSLDGLYNPPAIPYIASPIIVAMRIGMLNPKGLIVP